MSPENLKEEIIKINKPAAILEKDQIEAYLKSHQLNAKQSGTGLYYLILQEKKNEKQVVFGDQVKVNYKIYLLDGTLCYSSEKKGAKWIKVGHDNVETGVHESLQLMKAGEKGLFVMPSHLAHGLTGDQDKIPPRSPISVEIEIIEIKK
jgi:FKBP-type peptidyl-prolyl cis-trans isomerase